MTSKDPFSHSAFVIITGASGGYGHALVKCILPKLKENSVLVLSARNKEKLDEAVTKASASCISSESAVKIRAVVSDLSNHNDVDSFVTKCMENIDVNQFGSAMLFHNAGSLGDVTLHFDQHTSRDVISKYMDVNVSHVFLHTAEFLNAFSTNQATCYIVHISSLCAIKPFPSCGLYCTGKAARDMMFKVLAAESPHVRVLNWAPGPMRTRMLASLCNSCDDDISSTFKAMHAGKTFLECDTSAHKLISFLQKNEFLSGDHVDYYDV